MVPDSIRLMTGDHIGATNDDGQDRDTWVRETKESIDSVGQDFSLVPVVRRIEADTDSYSTGLRPLEDYFKPLQPADFTEAERTFCNSVASGLCTVTCNPLKRLGIKATCISLCISIAEKACAYIIHGDIPPCPVTVVIDENGVHHMVTVPCPM